jgi:hypothetical protein
MQGARVLILTGDFQGHEGVCLGQAADGLWAISPDDSDEILSLVFEKDFGLVVDLSGNPEFNQKLKVTLGRAARSITPLLVAFIAQQRS